MRVKLFATLSAILLVSGSPGPIMADVAKSNPAPAGNGPLMQAMEKELARSFSKLKNAGPAPVHYLAYRVKDEQSLNLSASYGAIDELPMVQRNRELNVELRVGSPKLDSTHQLRDRYDFGQWSMPLKVPVEDDENAIRAVLWNETDSAYKQAQKAFK